MADEEKETESTEPKKKKKPLLLIIIVLVVLLGGGGALYFLVLKKPAEDPAVLEGVVPEQTAAAGPAAPRAASAEPGPMQAYPPFTVNLADPGGSRYLKITIALELSKEEEFPAEVTAKEPKVKDAILTVLSSKTFDEVSTTQGKVALKQEILRRLNTLMLKGRIEEVYITEFMMQ